MPNWLVTILAAVYTRIPAEYRPPIKKAFYWVLVRIEFLAKRRRIHSSSRVEFIDFEIAHLEPYEFLGPGLNEVLVEVFHSTVSPGTERAVLCGLPGARKSFPYVPGYSTAGKVIAVGKGVSEFSVGDRVAGRAHHTSHETVRTNTLFKMPDGVSYTEASFIELGIITLQGVRKAKIKPGDRVAVVGQGLIGQMANRLVRLQGASSVIAVAPSARRAQTALAPGGADQFIALLDGGAVRAVSADVVIEAVGTPDAVDLAMQCAREGGKVVLLGSSRGISRDVDYYSAAQKQGLQVIGAHISAIPDRDASRGLWTYRDEGELFLDLLAARRLSVAELVTWRARPDECNAVYERLAVGGGREVGIVFDWKASVAAEQVKVEPTDQKLA